METKMAKMRETTTTWRTMTTTTRRRRRRRRVKKMAKGLKLMRLGPEARASKGKELSETRLLELPSVREHSSKLISDFGRSF